MIRNRIAPQVQMTILEWVSGDDRAYVLDRMERLLTTGREPVTKVHLIVRPAHPGRRHRPTSILLQAELDVNGDPVRAHVTAESVREGADLLQEVLRNRLTQRHDRIITERRHRKGDRQALRWTRVAPPDADATAITRRKTFAVDPMTSKEAAAEMTLLGHDFYLYLDQQQGQYAVVWQEPGEPVSEKPSHCVMFSHAPLLTLRQAVERLSVAGERFVFFQDADEHLARVLYRRRAGDLGLIVPAVGRG